MAVIRFKEEAKYPEVKGEYIYNFHMVWKDDVRGHIDIERGAVVRGVAERDGRFEFSVDGMEGTYYCHYGWAFIPNTPENIEMCERMEEIDREILGLEEEKKAILNSITPFYEQEVGGDIEK